MHRCVHNLAIVICFTKTYYKTEWQTHSDTTNLFMHFSVHQPNVIISCRNIIWNRYMPKTLCRENLSNIMSASNFNPAMSRHTSWQSRNAKCVSRIKSLNMFWSINPIHDAPGHNIINHSIATHKKSQHVK